MNAGIRTIVVGLGDLHDPDPHLAPAIQFAESIGALVFVVHAFHPPDPAPYPYPDVSVFSPEVMEQYYAGVRRDLEEVVGKLSKSGRVETRAVPAPAAAGLLEVADEVGADLVVVGATRRGAVARTLLGTTAQRVARGAHAPVLVIRREGAPLPRRILLTADLSEHSAAVQGRALELIDQIGTSSDAAIRALMAIGYDIPISTPLDQSGLMKLAREQLDAFIDQLASPRVISDRKVRRGDPVDEIVAEAAQWEADLVVVGTHGRKGPSRFLIGSVAEGVLRRVECNVLVIPRAAVTPDSEEDR